MKFSVLIFHNLLTGNDPSTNITFEPVPDLQVRDRLTTVGWTRKTRIRLYQGLILKRIKNGFPLMFFEGMRTFRQMAFEVLLSMTGLTIGTNGDSMLMIVLNE
jgi:hypothetical protein